MTQTPAAHAMPTPGSGPTCPGCSKAVDPLRAGHVAIFEGHFLYYCDATCKALHLRAIAEHIGDEVATLDPPAVASLARALRGPGERRPSAARVSQDLKHATGWSSATEKKAAEEVPRPPRPPTLPAPRSPPPDRPPAPARPRPAPPRGVCPRR